MAIGHMHEVKAMANVVLSAGIWAPIVAQLPEHLPLVAMSGLAGGIARWIALKERAWPDGLGTIVIGMTASVFLWPLGQPLVEPMLGKLEMEPVTAVMFGGFVTGLMGVSLIGWLLDIARAKKGGSDAQGDD